MFFSSAIGMLAQSSDPKGIVVASATTSLPPAGASRMGVLNVRLASKDMARNEWAAVDVCRDYVEAQLKYFTTNPNRNGFFIFAQKIRSTPGQRDGLYWPIGAGEDESPIGPNVAAAAITEQQASEKARPFSGYYFKTLLRQGRAAAGGARDYRIGGLLLTGFALLAWPAEYGVSGVHSFMVSHSGDVYARNLGADTKEIALRLSAFEPDHNWAKVPLRREDE
jgi:hypothetical protein